MKCGGGRGGASVGSSNGDDGAVNGGVTDRTFFFSFLNTLCFIAD